MRIVVHDYAGHPFQFDLSRELARRGHDVTHMYFAGDQGPKGATSRSPTDPETFAIIPVEIGRSYSKADFVGRWVNDRDYGAAAARHIRRLAPDVVISGNTPLDAQGAIIRATQAAGGVFINWVQDFYGLAIERLLANRWKGLGRLVAMHYRAMEKRQFARSDGVVLISQAFRAHMQGYSGPESHIAVIPNWGALTAISPRPKSNPWSVRHGLADKFVFLYSGTLGLKHNPDLLLALADAFADKPDVVVVVAATGTGRARLDASLASSPRANLKTLELQPFNEFNDFLGASDVVLALLEADAGEFSVPSKILSYMCAGRPTLLSAPLGNVGSQMIAEIGAGLVVPPGDAPAFVAAGESLYGNAEARAAAGRAARAYAEQHFEIGLVADRFEALFAQARKS